MLTFLTGFIASVAHVATGPDHLAAVTPLAIDSRKKSWMIGFSWGLGHTLGMLLIGALFIVFKEFLPVEAISKHSDTVIGFLLIGIGIWALVRMYRRHTHGFIPHAHFHTKPFLYPHIHKHTHAVPLVFEEPVGPVHSHSHTVDKHDHAIDMDGHIFDKHDHTVDRDEHTSDKHNHTVEKDEHTSDKDHHSVDMHDHTDNKHVHTHEMHIPFYDPHIQIHDRHDFTHDHPVHPLDYHLHHHNHEPDHRHDHHHGHTHDYGHGHSHTGKVKQNAFSAFLIGTVHGFAGFSHLFALLPSLALPSLWSSVIYVLAFATGTILTMISFAFILGIVAHRSETKQKLLFLKWFSFTGALLAIAIGVLWIFNPIA